MPFRRKHPLHPDSSVPMIIAALLIGVMIGFASGWEVSSLQQRKAASKLSPQPAPAAAPSPSPAPASAEEPAPDAVPATYRAVVDKVGTSSLAVTVMEGAAGEPAVTLIVTEETMLVALRPGPELVMDGSAADTSRGLPAPETAPQDGGYKKEAMELSAFRPGDVVEFSTAAEMGDGAKLAVAEIVWIMNLQDQAGQPGPQGDGGPAPLRPKR